MWCGFYWQCVFSFNRWLTNGGILQSKGKARLNQIISFQFNYIFKFFDEVLYYWTTVDQSHMTALMWLITQVHMTDGLIRRNRGWDFLRDYSSEAIQHKRLSISTIKQLVSIPLLTIPIVIGQKKIIQFLKHTDSLWQHAPVQNMVSQYIGLDGTSYSAVCEKKIIV